MGISIGTASGPGMSMGGSGSWTASGPPPRILQGILEAGACPRPDYLPGVMSS